MNNSQFIPFKWTWPRTKTGANESLEKQLLRDIKLLFNNHNINFLVKLAGQIFTEGLLPTLQFLNLEASLGIIVWHDGKK